MCADAYRTLFCLFGETIIIVYSLSDYHFVLPENLIAQKPLANREDSRLLFLEKKSGRTSHHRFLDICSFLHPGDVLIVNNTSVVPVRLFGRKKTGGKTELLILNYSEGTSENRMAISRRRRHQCLIKAAIRPKPGTIIEFDNEVVAEIVSFADGVFTVDFFYEGEFETHLYRIGRVPLPHYIHRTEGEPLMEDTTSYQTVYALEKGATAAPTAGLHFTEKLLKKITEQGVLIAPITLHVGYGTFMPVRVADIREHRMHSEPFRVSIQSAEMINQAKAEGRRVIAVGTTSVRTLEFLSDDDGRIQPGSGQSNLFIYPGYRFKVIDAMITNFHLPQSTLLMLISAFAGKDAVLDAYNEAIREQYRFFSYGDAMFIG
jgi:S-adenosylmethionine:tRNA ribosyltransferase-isomerase